MHPNLTNLFFHTGDIAFLTKHGKEKLVAPILEPFLGAKIRHADGFDTDSLGTFTRDVKRIDSQLETARVKARKGMEITRLSMGLGSEGSFAMDPYHGFIPWNTEMPVFLDDVHGIELVGIAEGPARVLQRTGRSVEEIVNAAIDFGFPENHVIVRPDTMDDSTIVKDIATVEQLRDAARYCLEASKSGIACLENDLRAYACPTRQEPIRLAAINLLLKAHSLCPACKTPGYWVSRSKRGLPCVHCRLPTDVPESQVYECHKCGYSSEIKRMDLEFADQGSCEFCNP